MSTYRFGLKPLAGMGAVSVKLQSKFGLTPLEVIPPEEVVEIPPELLLDPVSGEYSFPASPSFYGGEPYGVCPTLLTHNLTGGPAEGWTLSDVSIELLAHSGAPEFTVYIPDPPEGVINEPVKWYTTTWDLGIVWLCTGDGSGNFSVGFRITDDSISLAAGHFYIGYGQPSYFYVRLSYTLTSGTGKAFECSIDLIFGDAPA